MTQYIAAKCAPAADVAPVVHGRWILVDGGQYKCSRCHTVRKTDVAMDHYCPNCGARMDSEQEAIDAWNTRVPNLDTEGGTT